MLVTGGLVKSTMALGAVGIQINNWRMSSHSSSSTLFFSWFSFLYFNMIFISGTPDMGKHSRCSPSCRSSLSSFWMANYGKARNEEKD